jgi:HlyD family secretion protein
VIGRFSRVAVRLAILSALAFGVWRLKTAWPLRVRASSQASESTAIDATRVLRGPFVMSVIASGKLQARQTVTVRIEELEGKLTWIAPDGSPIKKGDVLARLDDAELKRQVRDIGLEYENARAEIEKAGRDRELEQRNSKAAVDKAAEELRILKEANQVQLKQAQAQLDFSKAELERLTTEYNRKKRQAEERLIPTTEVEVAELAMKNAAFSADKAQKELKLQEEKAASAVQQKETEIENARFTVETSLRRSKDDTQSARSRLDNIKRRLDDAKQKLAWCVIRAPATGLLVLTKEWRGGGEGRRVARPGDQLRPYSSLADIPDLALMAVNCKIQEREMGAVHIGQSVIVRLDERPTQAFHGRVAQISSVAEEISPWEDAEYPTGTKVFNVTVELKERDPKRLVPGMNATMEIITQRISSSVYVSKGCVFDRGTDHAVYVRRGARFDPVVVKPGEENATHVRILRGLRGGEWVATSDPTRRIES